MFASPHLDFADHELEALDFLDGIAILRLLREKPVECVDVRAKGRTWS